ncbi:XrtY-associated glycosyltransferase XYAG1 [Pedobacter sp. UC225_65]|uniref:XrtY-associated glycosyltransferase XYAG1 n=1 Tax=Pedobacter sp. UC225_65 TaxID=3350173 RepID=UPI00366AF882
MSIKVLQITAAYKPAYIYGGPTMSVSKLCEALVEANVDTEVLTTTANGKTELDVEPNKPAKVDGVDVTYFKRLTKDHTHFSPALLSGLRKKIRSYTQLHLVVHIHAWWNLVSIFSCALAKWYNVPVVLSPRGMLTNYTAGNRNAGFKSIIHNTIGKNLLRYCHVHVTSEKEKQDVLAIIQPKSITIIPNLVNFPILKANNPQPTLAPKSMFKLIFLSRIEEKKGLELLLDALASVNFIWELTIAGSGENSYVESLKRKALELNISDQIKWIGQVNNKEKFELMAKHDLLVLTSYNENFANVVIESLSMGTPVLLSDQVGLFDYVQEKNLGWISNLNISDITAQLNLSYEKEDVRLKIRETAPGIILEDFNSTTLINKYIKLYQNIS